MKNISLNLKFLEILFLYSCRRYNLLDIVPIVLKIVVTVRLKIFGSPWSANKII